MFARVFLFGTLIATFAGAATEHVLPSTLPPTRITLRLADTTLQEAATTLAKASGIAIGVDPRIAKRTIKATFSETPFWEALEQIARSADAKIVLKDNGRKVELEARGQSRLASGVSGPFRVVANQVIGRALLDSGITFHELQFDVHWEPRYPVFRIDTIPKIKIARDDMGHSLAPEAPSALQNPIGASIEMRLRLSNLPRGATKIALLEGEFRATVAEKLLEFKFSNLNSMTPTTLTSSSVSAVLKSLKYDETTKLWVAELEMTYPDSHPVFESFEEPKWLRDHRLQFVLAGKPVEATSEEIEASGRRVSATYRFKDINPNANGAALVLQAPSPLMEITVPFKLKDIAVP